MLAAGGDGTIRDGRGRCWPGTDVAMAIVPAGTGNLLARNLELPLDVNGALDVAVGSDERRVDTVVLRWTAASPTASP